MRARSYFIEISISTGIHAHPNGYSAQIYQHKGKSEIVYGKMLCAGMTIEEIKEIITRAFQGIVRSVCVTYKSPLTIPGETIDFDPVAAANQS